MGGSVPRNIRPRALPNLGGGVWSPANQEIAVVDGHRISDGHYGPNRGHRRRAIAFPHTRRVPTGLR
jgi:hypothetical protein